MNRIQMQTRAQTYAQTHAQTQLQTPAETFVHAQLQTHAHQNMGPHAGLSTNSQAQMQAPAPHALQSRAWLPENLTLTDVQADTLVAMIEEERMAGDVYELLAEQTGLVVFDRIAASEDRHEGALLRLAEAANIDLSAISGLPAGQYANAELQALYDGLIAQASASTEAALEVGVMIETLDIADLQAALVEVVGTPLWTVYSHLLDGSQQHLAAFDGLLGG